MWFAIVGKRTFQLTTARTRSPGGEARSPEKQRLVRVEAVRVDEVGADAGVGVQLDPALVGHLAAAGRVEGRLAQLGEEEPVAELLEGSDLREHVDLPVARRTRTRTRPSRAKSAARWSSVPAPARESSR